MIELTDADAREFQALVLRETGRHISLKEAHEQALNLITLVDFVLRPQSRLFEP